MKSCDMSYCDGILKQLKMFDPDCVSFTDCRTSDADPFVTLNISDGHLTVSVFLAPALAKTLYFKLGNLLIPAGE